MARTYGDLLTQLRAQLAGPLGKLSGEVRREILDGRIVDGALNTLIVKVRANASSIDQQDIDVLKRDGWLLWLLSWRRDGKSRLDQQWAAVRHVLRRHRRRSIQLRQLR